MNLPLCPKSFEPVHDGAYRARLVETTVDSGPWPCEYPGAQAVKLSIAEAPPQPPPIPPKPGVYVAESELKPHEIQDLADILGDIVSAAAGYDLTFHLRIELSGESPPPDEVQGKLNEFLEDISPGFRFD